VTINHRAGGGNLVNLTGSSAGNVVLAGIKFMPGSGTGRYLFVNGASDSQPVIVHDCYFNLPDWQLICILTWEAPGGLFYNDTFESSSDGGGHGPGSGSEGLQIRSPKPWYDLSSWGNADVTGANNLYIEDCTFRDIYASGGLDSDDCARVVVRHCVLENFGMSTHGITSRWGGRHVEIYQNQLRYVKRPRNSAGIEYCNMSRWYWARAGTLRIWGNTVDAINSYGTWGATKASWVFTNEPLTRPGAGNGTVCETEVQYPGTRWCGTGSDGTAHPTGEVVSPSSLDPVYVWDNQGTGGATWATQDQSGYGCSGGTTANTFKVGRDIILSAPSGYVPYTYPHPLRAGGGNKPKPTPTPLPSPTATPIPSPSPTPVPSPTPPPSGATWNQWLNQQAQWIHDHPPTPDTP
jgi:hypothetical protein